MDRLASNLSKQQQRSVILPKTTSDIAARRTESKAQQTQLLKQLEKLKAASKVLCMQVQEALSVKYNGRPVNIMGVLKALQ